MYLNEINSDIWWRTSKASRFIHSKYPLLYCSPKWVTFSNHFLNVLDVKCIIHFFLAPLKNVKSASRRRQILVERLDTDNLCQGSVKNEFFCARLSYKRDSNSAPLPKLYRKVPNTSSLDGTLDVTVYYPCEYSTYHKYARVSFLNLFVRLSHWLLLEDEAEEPLPS